MLLIQLAIILVYGGLSYLIVTPWTTWVWLVVGLIMGWLLLFLDDLSLHRFYLDRTQLDQRPRPLISRSLLFLIAFVPLSLFVVTSSGSLIGGGMVISMAVVYMSELLLHKNNPQVFAQKFLWQTRSELKQNERNLLSWSSVVLVALLMLLSLF